MDLFNVIFYSGAIIFLVTTIAVHMSTKEVIAELRKTDYAAQSGADQKWISFNTYAQLKLLGFLFTRKYKNSRNSILISKCNQLLFLFLFDLFVWILMVVYIINHHYS